MTVEEWRAMNPTPGMEIQRIADARVGTIESLHKDAAVVTFPRPWPAEPIRSYCPCQMLCPVGQPPEPAPDATHRIKKICLNCGKVYYADTPDRKHCDNCKKEAQRRALREYRARKKAEMEAEL